MDVSPEKPICSVTKASTKRIPMNKKKIKTPVPIIPAPGYFFLIPMITVRTDSIIPNNTSANIKFASIPCKEEK